MFKSLVKLSLKNKLYTSLIVFILILGSLIYFVIIPTVRDIKKIETEINTQRIDLEEKYIKGQSLKQLSENLKKIEPRISILDDIYIKQDHELEFITSLEKLATKNNVTQNINFDTTRNNKESGYQTFPLGLTTQGSYLDQLNYLAGLEALNFYININSIALSSSGPVKSPTSPEEEKPSVNITMTIKADTYGK